MLSTSFLNSPITNAVQADEERTKSRQLSDLSISSSSIFYTPTVDEVEAYYNTGSNAIVAGDKGESLIQKIEAITKTNQQKVNYTSGLTANASGASTAWKGYYLYERDYSISPLTQYEVTNNTYSTTGIWLTVMYSSSPIYVKTSINSGEYSYYTDWSVTAHSGTVTTSDTFTDSNKAIDREHVFPKSYGFNSSTDKTLYEKLVVGCDAHNLHAGEHVANSSAHSNLPYGNVYDKTLKTSKEYVSKLTGEVIGYTGYNSKGYKVYEPLEKDKGNIARACFYMAARYHTYGNDINDSSKKSPALTLSDEVQATATVDPASTATKACAYGELSELLEWNAIDPVDDEEIRRNDLIYKGIQNNRNPFVDFPSWADACFGSGTVDYTDMNIRCKYLGIADKYTDTPTPIPTLKNGFSKYTSVNDFKIGNKVILGSVYDSKYYSISHDQRNNNRAAIECSFNDTNCTPNISTEIFTVVAGTKANTFAFMAEDGRYIYAASSSGNYLRSDTALDDNGSFAISLVGDLFHFVASGTSERNIIYYNSQFSLFGCYASTHEHPCDLTVYGYTPDPFASVKPEANLSFTFKDTNGVYSDFSNVSINIRMNYDFSTRDEITHSGFLMVEKSGDILDYTRENYFSTSLDTTGKKVYEWKDYAKDTCSLSITNIPSTAYKTQLLFVGYVMNGGVAYFSTPVVYSVYTLLERYSLDDSMLEFTNKDSTKTSIKVSDIAKAFLNTIGGQGGEED